MKQLLFPILLATVALSSCGVYPKAAFSVPTRKFVAPAEVTFTNMSLQAESYAWDFGDGTSSMEESPKHTYSHSGNYTVILQAKKGTKTVVNKQMIQVKQIFFRFFLIKK